MYRFPPLTPSRPTILTALSLYSILSGVSVAIVNRYCPQNYIGWLFSFAGFVLLSFVGPKTHGAGLAGLQLPAAIGLGILYSAVTFPIMAPLGVGENAHALAFFMFVRTFSYVSTHTRSCDLCLLSPVLGSMHYTPLLSLLSHSLTLYPRTFPDIRNWNRKLYHAERT